ncbi:uncharacterized protein LOC135833273 [Planococcus citri]|uniref:uncharacterized protein LOC135833273 n=1 Tax=Planococcus citri TaxID=170843 RepID=UPI0031F8F722
MDFLLKVLLISGYLATLTVSSPLNEYSPELKNTYAEECKKELNASKEDFLILNSEKVPKNEVQSCLVDCLYTKLGAIKGEKWDEDAHIRIIKTKYANEKEKFSEVKKKIKKCAAEAKKSPNETCGIGKNLRTCLDVLKKNKNTSKSTNAKNKDNETSQS